MESSSSTAPRSSSFRLSRVADREREDAIKATSHRSTRYKEKYQAMREKYDQVTAKQEEYKRDLDTAGVKIKKLQAENDLLLDAMDIADSSLVERYFPSEPLPDIHDTLPIEAISGPIPADYDQEANPRRLRRLSRNFQVNGNSNGHSNGVRHQPDESQAQHHPDQRDPGATANYVDVNGRMT